MKERHVADAELAVVVDPVDGTMNFASGGDYIMVNTPTVLRTMARQVQAQLRPKGLRGWNLWCADGSAKLPVHYRALSGHR